MVETVGTENDQRGLQDGPHQGTSSPFLCCPSLDDTPFALRVPQWTAREILDNIMGLKLLVFRS